MVPSSDLGDFLRAGRGRLDPAEVGVVSHGQRRVPGLRREELAQLAGVSHTYYTRLEQGHSSNASDAVLDALSRALRLTPDEHLHLRNLARPAAPQRRTAARPERVRAPTRRLTEAVTDVPVIVVDRRNDVLAWNRLAHVLLAGHLDPAAPDRPPGRPNLLRMLFLDPHTRELHRDWDGEAQRAVASLRLVAGQYAGDRALAELIGELAIGSPEFAVLWARHRVHNCTSGTKRYHHPTVGPLDLAFTVLQTADGSGHRLLMMSATTGSADAAALSLLRSSIG
jgi:transcriptional regulator with XRE-family HTH domain